MVNLDVMFGKSDGQKRAEQARQDAEDRLMLIHDLEKTDLKFHTECDGERHSVFLTRLRELGTDTKSRADRNLLATIGIGLAVLVKGGTSTAVLLQMAAKMFGLP